MCGICGVLSTGDGLSVAEDVLRDMCDTMSHRGPDDEGVWRLPEQRIALGHRRLSIVDLSSAGHQPMSNEDGTVWVTFGGEIYNHAALREELEAKGHVYRSRTDSETIVHLYEEEGVHCVERMEGMFSIAIWDTRRRRLLLARDRLGIKPLYYARRPDGFMFASEIKALLAHPAIEPDLNEEAFFHYLTFVCTPAPMTMFRGIEKLAAGERMVVSADGSVRRDTYWSPLSSDSAREVAGMSEPELKVRLMELLRGSIGRQMMSDVPWGVFLSGGVDSSTNVALMSELMDEPVRTFSVAFKDQPKYNELEHARTIAKRFGTDHHEVTIDSGDLESFLTGLVHHQDEPLADWVCVPLYYVSKLARDNGTIVVQVGEGSDEIFHGYQKYIDEVRRRERFWEPVQRVPRPLRMGASRAATALSRWTGRGAVPVQQWADAAQGRLPFWGGAIAWQGDMKERVLERNGRAHPDSYAIVERLWEEAEQDLPGADLYQKMTYLELKQRLAELLLMRVDKMTMATSVEARVPFLDESLVQFALALPPEMKVRDGVGKWLLKETVSDLLPRDIVFRKKQGFGAPVAEWFRSDFGDRIQRQIRESSLAERGLLDYDELDRLWDMHRSGPANWSFHLWNIYNVSAWHDYWVAGRSLA